MIRKCFVIICLSALLGMFVSCKREIKKEASKTSFIKSTHLKYAKGFSIEHYTNYIKLIIKKPFPNATEAQVFTLSKFSNNKAIQIPLTSIVVTSTTHIPFLELLEVENKLTGFPNTTYISSLKTRELLKQGNITDLGNEEHINTELLLQLKPDAVIGFSINSNNKMFATIEKLGIPVLLNGDWLEETPLGRAEWIKFFGVLFDKEKEADSIFNAIEFNYKRAAQIAQKATSKPTVVSGGLFKDIWNLPAGESFEATFLNDAHTNYLWSHTKGRGSLSLNIEHVFETAKEADIWISPSFYDTLSHLKNANAIYSKFKAFNAKNVFSYVNTKGETGGLIYFELAPARPDLVLKDLIKIAHHELMEDYNFTFYKRLN